jgi:hypothetical protein
MKTQGLTHTAADDTTANIEYTVSMFSHSKAPKTLEKLSDHIVGILR